MQYGSTMQATFAVLRASHVAPCVSCAHAARCVSCVFLHPKIDTVIACHRVHTVILLMSRQIRQVAVPLAGSCDIESLISKVKAAGVGSPGEPGVSTWDVLRKKVCIFKSSSQPSSSIIKSTKKLNLQVLCTNSDRMTQDDRVLGKLLGVSKNTSSSLL